MSSQVVPRYTPEQYLELERRAEHRSEYVNGQILASPGHGEEHNTITVNVAAALHAQFRGRPCRAYVSDMRVRITDAGMYAYPDVVAVCGERRFEDAQVDTLINPTVVIEVLSPSTEAYDRGAKTAHYRRIASLRKYVLIAQDRRSVERYSRPDGMAHTPGDPWTFAEFTDPDAVVHLASVGCELRVGDVYDGVEFPDDAGERPGAGGEDAPRPGR